MDIFGCIVTDSYILVGDLILNWPWDYLQSFVIDQLFSQQGITCKFMYAKIAIID